MTDVITIPLMARVMRTLRDPADPYSFNTVAVKRYVRDGFDGALMQVGGVAYHDGTEQAQERAELSLTVGCLHSIHRTEWRLR